MSNLPRITIWNEFIHERRHAEIAKIYPNGMHGTIAEHLRAQGFEVQTATLDQPEHGLTDEVLANTDVLLWWGHMAHAKVADEVVEKVHQRIVAEGMGLIALHSAHFSKIFVKLMGTTCNLKWREMGEKERLWVVNPGHPIARGIGDYIEIPNAEMYGEHFDIPQPDEQVFVSWFQGGEVFRSGNCFFRGRGKIFYFRPGHETYPIFHQPEILKVIENAIYWAAPAGGPGVNFGHFPTPLESFEISGDQIEIEHPEESLK
ncbi:MAG: trehalose utilization protein ThuA [Chloroflexota bacterium]|nr:MAG: trehalose utilization protein ThuA [Chloroflexota bacterium]